MLEKESLPLRSAEQHTITTSLEGRIRRPVRLFRTSEGQTVAEASLAMRLSTGKIERVRLLFSDDLLPYARSLMSGSDVRVIGDLHVRSIRERTSNPSEGPTFTVYDVDDEGSH